MMHVHVFRLLGFSALVALCASLAPACGGGAEFTDTPGPSGSDCSRNGQTCTVLCDGALGCVDCITDDDCGAAAPECIQGECEECAAATDCAPGESCYPKDHECRDACADNGDCNGDEPLCDTPTGACVGCIDANDCDQDELCSATTQQCVECNTADDCSAAEPYCDDDGRCRDCLVDGHCGAGELCVDHECRAGCLGNDDCPNDRPICDDAECVECASGDDCGVAEPICDENRCVECRMSSDCNGEILKVCNDRECVECNDDEDCEMGLQCDGHECRAN